MSVLFANFEVAFIDAAVDELFFANSVLHIVFPRPFIPLAVRMSVHSESVSAVTIEFARVNVTICMVEAALSLGHAIAPVAFIVGSVSPNLLALAVLDPDHLILGMFHLARVDGAIAKLIRIFELECRLIQVGDGRSLGLALAIESKLRITLLDD